MSSSSCTAAAEARMRLEKRLADKNTVDMLALMYPRLAEQLYAARLRLLIRRQLLSICHSPDGVHGHTSPDWDAAMQAARSPPVAAAVGQEASEDSMLQQLDMLQLLVQQSAAWQAIRLYLQQQSAAAEAHGRAAQQAGSAGTLPLQPSLSGETAHTACPLADDASSQCCEVRPCRRGRAAEEEEVSSGRPAARTRRRRAL